MSQLKEKAVQAVLALYHEENIRINRQAQAVAVNIGHLDALADLAFQVRPMGNEYLETRHIIFTGQDLRDALEVKHARILARQTALNIEREEIIARINNLGVGQ